MDDHCCPRMFGDSDNEDLTAMVLVSPEIREMALQRMEGCMAGAEITPCFIPL